MIEEKCKVCNRLLKQYYGCFICLAKDHNYSIQKYMTKTQYYCYEIGSNVIRFYLENTLPIRIIFGWLTINQKVIDLPPGSINKPKTVKELQSIFDKVSLLV